MFFMRAFSRTLPWLTWWKHHSHLQQRTWWKLVVSLGRPLPLQSNTLAGYYIKVKLNLALLNLPRGREYICIFFISWNPSSWRKHCLSRMVKTTTADGLVTCWDRVSTAVSYGIERVWPEYSSVSIRRVDFHLIWKDHVAHLSTSSRQNKFQTIIVWEIWEEYITTYVIISTHADGPVPLDPGHQQKRWCCFRLYQLSSCMDWNVVLLTSLAATFVKKN